MQIRLVPEFFFFPEPLFFSFFFLSLIKMCKIFEVIDIVVDMPFFRMLDLNHKRFFS